MVYSLEIAKNKYNINESEVIRVKCAASKKMNSFADDDLI